MDALYKLLKDISALERAPRTVKGDYPAPRSPYKPILLLIALSRIHKGIESYASNRIEFEHCLKDFGNLYSRLFGSSSEMAARASQAFWYLGAGKPKVWELVPKPGMEEELKALIEARVQIKTAVKLNKLVAFARFPLGYWNLLTDSDVQRALISFLIAEHFADVRRELEFL
jgi:predicted restriction endonuclease